MVVTPNVRENGTRWIHGRIIKLWRCGERIFFWEDEKSSITCNALILLPFFSRIILLPSLRTTLPCLVISSATCLAPIASRSFMKRSFYGPPSPLLYLLPPLLSPLVAILRMSSASWGVSSSRVAFTNTAQWPWECMSLCLCMVSWAVDAIWWDVMIEIIGRYLFLINRCFRECGVRSYLLLFQPRRNFCWSPIWKMPLT